MPRIFDNNATYPEQVMLHELRASLQESQRADFCVGYFNLRGWRLVGDIVDEWQGGADNAVRVLVGMQKRPQDEFQDMMHQHRDNQILDNGVAKKLKNKLAQEFRAQLIIGTPSNADEAGLRQLAQQLHDKKVVVRLYLETPLHAKLYLLYQKDNRRTPVVGMVGSSNLTMPGLASQGELNVEILESDTTPKLVEWFEDRWNRRWTLDISEELIDIINESWARPQWVPPYHIYIKMAYHLSQEARTGLSEFTIPKDLDPYLFEYQKAAVKVAAHHINRWGGVLIGDVVGLGKTLMATTLAKIFEDDYSADTLILCPPNLKDMWQKDYVERYNLRAKVLPISQARSELPDLRRYWLVIIDESHNLRNREGKTYAAIKDYLERNDSRVVLLSATPYNKTYLDLSNQLRLFVPDDQDLGIRPERLIKEMGETKFVGRFQTNVRTLQAFEHSEYPDDWRELMRLYMVRRTRSFIQDNYAQIDPINQRKYLTYADRDSGETKRNYFPKRIPRTLKFDIAEGDPYSNLYNDRVVSEIRHLQLPRYGLGQYIQQTAEKTANKDEKAQLDNLSRAGKRLIGFSRTNLFKRLESSGAVFLQSLQRHIVRNAIYIYALDNELPLPIGTQDADLLTLRDEDLEAVINTNVDVLESETEDVLENPMHDIMQQAQRIYAGYQQQKGKRFKWIPSRFFKPTLRQHLEEDALTLQAILDEAGGWDAQRDSKLALLVDLITQSHPNEKILVFSQFADTVKYLEKELTRRGIRQVAGVVGTASNPSAFARRFSPRSNNHKITPEDELRVLIATDVLSEGQNLQDAHIVVNYDIAWAIIRLIQRAGRVDRIGQQSHEIYCYSFVPADGVERIIRLRERIITRLQENAEVVGTDERFFEEEDRSDILDLYNEKADILDEGADNEVDLSSYALEIWNQAIARDPALKPIIERMPLVSYGARAHIPNPNEPEGALVYLRTHNHTDLLAWLDREGNIISESQFAILNAARCAPQEPAVERAEYHHSAVETGTKSIMEAQQHNPFGGQLGRTSGARYRAYDRLKAVIEGKPTLFHASYVARGIHQALEDIYKFPLRPTATDSLNRQLKARVSDHDLVELVLNLHEGGRLCVIREQNDDDLNRPPQIICSLNLRHL
jgi:superfamily II DNA or RNA helicase